MSRSFLGVGQVPYIGTPYPAPIQICNGGKVVPLFFDWNAYGASSSMQNINVKVTLIPPSNTDRLLKQIASVYVDNTNSPVPIYVYCPDTRYCAVAQPNSAGWYPLYTNATEIWVIGQGFTTGAIPQTQIFVCDLFVPPYTDQEIQQSSPLHLASASISRGGILFNQNVGVPAVADQTYHLEIDLAFPSAFTPIAFPATTGFIYLNTIKFLPAVAASPGLGAICQVVLKNSTTAPGIIWTFEWVDKGAPYLIETAGFSGLNIKLDATNAFGLLIQSNVPAGIVGQGLFKAGLTTNPK